MSRADLRQTALACFRHGVDAVEPSRLVAEQLARHPLPQTARTTLVAAGKAAAAMARGAFQALSGGAERGVVLVPAGTAGAAGLPPSCAVYEGGHPVPDEAGVRGARALRTLAEGLTENDVLICLLSGGGSALMTLPAAPLGLADLAVTTDLLQRAGAAIGELNAVRKHLEELKGGRLAALAAPARIVTLALSDVVGDPLDVIASGPTVPDTTTYADALGVLERRGVVRAVPEAVRRHLERGARGELAETPREDHPCFRRATAAVIGNNARAAEAALAEGRRRGFRTLLLTTLLTGEAREVGRVLASLAAEVRRSGRPVAPPACLLAAGETTVTVRGAGRGGRNQEVALGAALALEGCDGVLVAALGTDGIDGPTDAAGALATGETVARARALGRDAAAALAANDAYPFFDALGDLIRTGPTGTNVMDLVLVLVNAPPTR